MRELCTWENCSAFATSPQVAKDGKRWANLCPNHSKELDETIDVKGMLRCWVKAQGGPKGATEVMLKDGCIEKTQRFMKRLQERTKR